MCYSLTALFKHIRHLYLNCQLPIQNMKGLGGTPSCELASYCKCLLWLTKIYKLLRKTCWSTAKFEWKVVLISSMWSGIHYSKFFSRRFQYIHLHAIGSDVVIKTIIYYTLLFWYYLWTMKSSAHFSCCMHVLLLLVYLLLL